MDTSQDHSIQKRTNIWDNQVLQNRVQVQKTVNTGIHQQPTYAATQYGYVGGSLHQKVQQQGQVHQGQSQQQGQVHQGQVQQQGQSATIPLGYIPLNKQQESTHRTYVPSRGGNLVEQSAGENKQGGRRSAKKEHHNVQTLNTSTTYFDKSNEFLSHYFNYFINFNPDLLKEFYYKNSLLTFNNNIGGEIREASEHQGKDAIISQLSVFNCQKTCNVVHHFIQPGLGNGSVMVVRGNINEHQFSMFITIVKQQQRKIGDYHTTFYIQNHIIILD